MNPTNQDFLRDAIVALNAGDVAGALREARRVLASRPKEPRLHSLLGTILARMGDFPSAIDHLRIALRTDETDTGARINLARALNTTGDPSGAFDVCAPHHAARDGSMMLWRLRGYSAQQIGNLDGAIDAYRRVVARYPGDAESWNNLGNARADTQDYAGAIVALQQAAALQPDNIEVHLNLAAALGRDGRERETIAILESCAAAYPDDPRAFVELGSWLALLDREAEALAPLARAVALRPEDPDGHVRLALVQIPAGHIAEAERALRDAIALAPDHEDAHLKLAILLETNNRLDELSELLTQAKGRDIDRGAVAFIEALVLRRQRNMAEALAVAGTIRADIEPVRSAQLRGEIMDQIGDADAAWAAFVEMNRQATIADLGIPAERAARYTAEIRKTIDMMTPAWCAGWQSSAVHDDRRDPVFLVGSPRSGTTLLDTMLMGHDEVLVLEEQPQLRAVAHQLGELARLPDIDDQEIAALRATYFAAVDALTNGDRGRLLVDKFPLHMNKVALIHRLFPRSRFIFAERHPLDVVLSTFITNFRLNSAMCNYLDLSQAATLYDLCMSCWQRSTELIPVEIHRVRYERVVEDRETELRKLVTFLGLDWSSDMLDNQSIALQRGNIKTASYSQVTEKIYHRASGRWVRYRDHLVPIMPIITPWADRLGYDVHSSG